MTTPTQKIWDLIQPIIFHRLQPNALSFEWGETSCKFEKDGKKYEVKIKEVK